jgi:hypothetical protein
MGVVLLLTVKAVTVAMLCGVAAVVMNRGLEQRSRQGRSTSRGQ